MSFQTGRGDKAQGARVRGGDKFLQYYFAVSILFISFLCMCEVMWRRGEMVLDMG